MKKILWLTILLPLFLLNVSLAESQPNIFVVVSCDKSVYKTKEPIAMAITILNRETAPVKVTIPSSKKYDFYLYQEDEPIWQWSMGKMFSQSLGTVELIPCQPATYVFSFNQVLLSKKNLSPGKYKIFAAFCTLNKEYLSDPVDIEIRK